MGIRREKLTQVVHAGVTPEPQTGAIMTPIFQTSTFVQSSPGVHKGYDYSRADNPTRHALENSLAALENAHGALAFSSGLAAEQAVIQLLTPPGEVLVSDDVYGGTGRLFRQLFAKYGFTFKFVDMGQPEKLHQHISSKTAMLWVETPTNPTLKLAPIRELASLAQKHHSLLVVDNTFASPMFQNPLDLGADIVVHSTTKYIGGHSDLIGGAVMTKDQALYDRLKFIQFAAGSVPSPWECFMLLRSIKTLAVRMERHAENAASVAEALVSHPQVAQVYYPGLKNHPQHSLAREQMSGFSGMVSFDIKGDFSAVQKFLSKLKIFALAESLGGVESLVNHPQKMTHASVPEELRRQLGIGPSLLRLSVGLEAKEDLINDLVTALDA